MAWTTPRTWVNLEVVSHTLMNTHVRDNLQYIKDVLDGSQTQNVTLAKASTDAVAQQLRFRKARGTLGAPSGVTAGDTALDIVADAYNAGGYRNASLIQTVVDQVGGTSVGGILDFYTYRHSDGAALHGARVYNQQLLVADGSTSTPSLGFINDSDTGLARFNADDFGLLTGGSIAFWARRSAGVTQLGFYGLTPQARPTVTGAKGGNAALASLLTALNSFGLITDSST